MDVTGTAHRRALPVYTWPILAFAFSALILLIGFFTTAAWRAAQDMRASVGRLDEAHRQADVALEAIRTHIYTSSLIARDFIMDNSGVDDEQYREQIYANRAQLPSYLTQIRNSAGPAAQGKLQRLQAELDAYWTSLEPVFAWTPVEKQQLGYRFLRSNVIPRRKSVIRLAEEIGGLITANLETQRAERDSALQTFSTYLRRITWTAMI